MGFTTEAVEWIRRTIGGGRQPLEITRMKGSSSSSIFLVRQEGTSGERRFVLRVLDNYKWLADEPDLADHEAAALMEACRAGLAAPDLIGFTSENVGFGAPVVLMSFVGGAIDLRPDDFDGWISTLARELATIHRRRAEDFAWSFRSWSDKTIAESPEWSRYPRLWEIAIERVKADEPAFDPVFIHRDYHPMNVLWRDGAISGVVDWINACRGPASVDVAHCRTNLAGMYGADAAEQFLQAYLSCGGQPFDPYWDLDSLVDMCHPQPHYYDPWRDFGLGEISNDALRARMDAHLATVIARFK